VIVFLQDGAKSRLDGNPVYPTLDVARQGRGVFLGQDDLLRRPDHERGRMITRRRPPAGRLRHGRARG
jgi:hypothetical protein